MRRRGAFFSFACAALVLAAREARAEEAVASVDTGAPAAREPWHFRLPSWLALEEEGTPEPPVFRGEVGMLAWPVLRTSIKIGRQGGDPGREITDAEEQLGLPHQALSPYVEASVGSIVRAGADFLDLDRSERFRTVHETVNAKGVLLANPGGQVASRFHYLQASAFVEWEVVRGASYRFALIGGARYLRIATRLRGLQPDGSVLAVSRESDVLSPFFGGSVELTPVPTFAVFASVRFIDWAWSDIQLREQRYFISRIGAEVKFFDGAVGVALDFRFLSSSLDTGAVGKTRGRFVLDAAGVGLSVTCRLP